MKTPILSPSGLLMLALLISCAGPSPALQHLLTAEAHARAAPGHLHPRQHARPILETESVAVLGLVVGANQALFVTGQGTEPRADPFLLPPQPVPWQAAIAVAIYGLLAVVAIALAATLSWYRPAAARPVWIACGISLAVIVVALTLTLISLNANSQTASLPEPSPTLNAPTPEVDLLAETPSAQSPSNPTAPSEPSNPTAVLPDPSPVPPTSTPLPPPTLDPLVQCADAPQQGFQVGDRVRVCTKSDRLRLRSSPDRGGFVVLLLDPGARLTIIGGPVCEDGWLWWEVQTRADETGWVAEGSDATDPLYICPTR